MKYYPTIQPIDNPTRAWPGATVTRCPRWCAVDLRDGNQALPNPMNLDQKLEYYKLLLVIGFKEIEIGFPSASKDEFDFTRKLIEGRLIPKDVTINVLTQAREHLVARTLESLKGAHSAVVHFYTASSELHYRHVIGLERATLFDMVRKTTRQIRAARDSFSPGHLGLEFSPEEFTDTDLDMAIELCEAVVQTWEPRPGEKVILNLPATVERRPPNQYADMIEVFSRRINCRDRVVISLHAHNDQGCAVAATEMALMAGADRVEGTLFGHGERTGNVDLITVALNQQSRNIETGLNFSNLSDITEVVSRITGMAPHPRHPYAGELVFTAFSGSHQDAIGKCLAKQQEVGKAFGCTWKIPYLHIDPKTLGRSFERFIRINSQSGKGGISYVMESEFGIRMPKPLLQDFSLKVQQLADSKQKELEPRDLYELFEREYLDDVGPIVLERYYPRPDEKDPNHIFAEAHLRINGVSMVLKGQGNGPISAFAQALRPGLNFEFAIDEFEELSLNKGADARALAYVSVKGGGAVGHGVGLATNIDQAGVRATVVAINALSRAHK